MSLDMGKTVVERVRRQGMYQRITFEVVVEPTDIGRVKLLKSNKSVDLDEAVRIAAKYRLPVHADGMEIVLPPGSMLKDFLVDE
ncbi:hypothetical protein J7K41_01515 [Candidatus Micrarchaeota archaeon]|nr:hypothetical protein [Candidatus Micrarchaeota archaeon]